ncbi:MAG: SPASM domain-containing protein [Bacteroidaceae bacterium]|nr:SPASM domain-containing protein [Bacteroidaceae bacterium]
MFVASGKVSVCEQLYWHPQFIIGDLKTQSLTKICNLPKAKALFAFNKSDYVDSSCSKCKALDFCNTNKRRCYVKTIKAYGTDNWNYPDPRCEFSPKVESGMIYK